MSFSFDQGIEDFFLELCEISLIQNDCKEKKRRFLQRCSHLNLNIDEINRMNDSEFDFFCFKKLFELLFENVENFLSKQTNKCDFELLLEENLHTFVESTLLTMNTCDEFVHFLRKLFNEVNFFIRLKMNKSDFDYLNSQVEWKKIFENFCDTAKNRNLVIIIVLNYIIILRELIFKKIYELSA